MKYNVFTPLRNLYRKNTAILGRVGTGEIRVSIFRDQKGIPDTLEVLSNVDSLFSLETIDSKHDTEWRKEKSLHNCAVRNQSSYEN